MTSETSAVLVAVRVRPFHARENPLLCCVTVADSNTITATDLTPALSAPRANDKGGGGTNALASMSSSSAAGFEGSLVFDGAGGGAGLVSHGFSFDKIFWSVPAEVLPRPLSLLLETSVEVIAETGPTTAASPTTAGALYNHSSNALSGAKAGKGSAELTASGVVLSPRASAVHMGDGDAHGARGSARPSIVSLGVPAPSSTTSSTLRLHPALPCFAATPAYDSQSSVYEFIGPRLYQAAMSGFNTCLFAYGQTGSGKTHSMIGPPEQQQQLTAQHSDALGVMPRLCNDLFDLMHQEREADESVSYNVEVAFFEIYCEKVRDLLAPTTTASTTSGVYDGAHHGTGVGLSPNNSTATGTALRVRQHPTRGPYVEGLAHHKVKNAAAVMRCLMTGLRDRATAETRMNEHSSRSHAIMQLYLTRVTVSNEDGAVVTRTRECKLSVVDLAGSERVSQSGATGERFEETRNINLSLSSLGRVIQQLSEKQAGRHVIPAYRDSVLTWLLSDSLGGNSKTIMLATVAPSAYCYQQTINTLRFAGVAKKIINVATVNEDRHFQQIITELRQQIVRLTLQIESGKASEAHMAEIRTLRAERDRLLQQNSALHAKVATLVEPAVAQALRKRAEELEQDVAALRADKKTLQQRLLTTGNTLRTDLARREEQRRQLQEQLTQKEAEVQAWAGRFKHAIELAKTQTGTVADRTTSSSPLDTTTTETSVSLAQLSALAAAMEGGELGGEVGSAVDRALMQQQQQTTRKLRGRVQQLTQRLAAASRGEEEARDAAREAQAQLERAHARYAETAQQASMLEEQLRQTMLQLQRTQNELATLQPLVVTQAQDKAARSVREAALLQQLEQLREDYFAEKQTNVRLLLRVSSAEQERAVLRRTARDRQGEIAELEQLLLEESETSERYYLRMRHHRAMEEMQRAYQEQTASLHRRHGRAALCAPAPVPCAASSIAEVLSADEDDAADALLSFRETALLNAMDRTYAQLQYECISDESRRRLMLEQECAVGVSRLLARQVQLYRTELTAARRRVCEMAEEAVELESTTAQLRRERQVAHDHAASAHAELQAVTAALAASRAQCTQLEHTLADTEARAAREERTGSGLIAQLAELQAGYDELQRRCAMAERVAVEAQETLLRGTHESTTSEPTTTTLAELEAATRAGKERELHAVEEEMGWWKGQCARYRAELGAVHANLEHAIALRTAAESRREEEQAVLRQQVTSLEQSKTQLVADLDTTVRDYELRVREQADMIATLRHALDEETQLADESRRAAMVAHAALDTAQAQLSSAREELAAGRAEQQRAAQQQRALCREVATLRTQYAEVERALEAMRAREPEMYVLFDCSAGQEGERASTWMDKARLERDKLEQQKREVRQLNLELMQQVQRQTSRLRTVQRQLGELSMQSEPVSTTHTTDTSLEMHAPPCPPHGTMPVVEGGTAAVATTRRVATARYAGVQSTLTSDTGTDAHSSLPSSISPSQGSSTYKP